MNRSTFLTQLAAIVGPRHVLTKPAQMRRFTRGYRYGQGAALAVVQPGSLTQQWRVVQLCVAAGKIVIAQAANTGLTGGSTPHGNDYDREVVVINTMRLKGLHLLDGGKQVVAFPGTTLDELERALKPLGREPHSVIGSSCLGASVLGGICNNSGGSLIHRGPAYSELALFAKVQPDGRLSLVNHLGIDLGEAPEDILGRLDAQAYSEAQVRYDRIGHASDHDYANRVRDIEADSPARFNADTERLFEVSGSAGKVIAFAVRLDTFEAEKTTQVFYIGTNDPAALTDLRRKMLSGFASLPIAAEYIHRDAFNVAERYGKDTYLLIKHLGTGRLPALFAAKSRIDSWAERVPFLPPSPSDRLLQAASRLFPSHLPERMRHFRDRFEHHLMVKVGGSGIAETRAFLAAEQGGSAFSHFECTPQEGSAAFLHRFATAGAAVRYRAVHGEKVGGIVALDIALPRNHRDWVEHLPPQLDAAVLIKLYYGHFFCHVFHQDYILKPGQDWLSLEHQMLALLDQRGARYPAEHNFGHLYRADQAVAAHYQALDPCNCFNAGIGQTTKHQHWADKPSG